MSSLLESPAVLVLNQNYEPLNICNARRAFRLLDCGKAEMLLTSDFVLRSPSRSFPGPSVIRLVYLVRRQRPRVHLNRREVFLRDNYTCQYCGKQTRELTLDHVTPRFRGGAHTWENLVSACPSCNHRKGNRKPEEASMRLLRQPFEPHPSAYHGVLQRAEAKGEWLAFLPSL